MFKETSHIKFFFLLAFLSSIQFYGQEHTVTSKNLNIKIDEAINEVEFEDSFDTLFEVLFFIEKEKIQFKDDCINAKILYLYAFKEYTFSKNESCILKAKEALRLSKKCKNLVLTGITYNLIGLASFGFDKVKLEKIFNNKEVKNNRFYFFYKSIEALKKSGKEQYIIDVYHNTVFLAKEIQKWNECIKNAKITMTLIKKHKIKEDRLGPIYLYKAFSEIQLNNLKEAENDLKLAMSSPDLEEKVQYNSVHYMANHYYALIHKKNKEYELRVEKLEKAISFLIESIQYQNLENRMLLLKKGTSLEALKKEKEGKVFSQNILLFGTILILILSFLFGLRYFGLSKKNKALNNKLSNILENEKKNNKILEEKKEEINYLLKLNETTLYSKVLKITLFDESIRKIESEISTIIESKSTIKPNNLLSIERELLSLTSGDDIWEDFKVQFEITKPSFFTNLKSSYPTLSENELRHCAYIIAKLNTKEVASLIKVSPRSVETSRYRIKKKMNLHKDESLFDFLEKI